jgi:hypothetical protein
MTSNEDRQIDPSQYAAAIARWDNEGGAPGSPRSNTGARASNDAGSEWMAESPGGLKVDQVPGEDKKILECLEESAAKRLSQR